MILCQRIKRQFLSNRILIVFILYFAHGADRDKSMVQRSHITFVGTKFNIVQNGDAPNRYILLHGDAVLETEELVLPHPMMGLRKFVLLPFEEIASDFQIPHLNLTVKDLLNHCPDTTTVFKHLMKTQA